MATLVKGLHLFGTSKVFVRSLIIYQCLFTPDSGETKLASIERTYKELDGSFRYEESNIDYAMFASGGTFHLHDIFLTDRFGITVSFTNSKGQLEIFDLNSKVQRHPLLTILSLNKEEVLLLSHVEASSVG